MALGASGCFSPSFDRCHVSCGAGGSCPPGTQCLADGYCHGSDDEALCTGPQFDGSVADGMTDGAAVVDGSAIDGALPLCEPNDGASITPTEAGQLVITEIQKDPVTSEPAGEWFEIYNPSDSQNYDLMGLQVFDAQSMFNINSSLVIGPGCHLVLASSGDADANGGVSPVHYDYVDTWSLGNSGDEKVEIYNSVAEVIIDVVEFSPAAPWPDDDMGAAMSLGPGVGDMNLTAIANDDGNNWCDAAAEDSYGTGGQGTPGRANPLCP